MPTLTLRSREEMVGNRRVQIHEMTSSEIAWLKHQRFAAFAVGAMLGVIPFLLVVESIQNYCNK